MRINEKSIVQTEKCCWLCGNRNVNMLERHECFQGSNRKNSINDKLTVLLCGDSCHRNGKYALHQNESNALRLKREAQQAAMDYYGWDIPMFVLRYGKNYLEMEW